MVQWADKLLSGEKTVECRQYKLPDDLYGKRILLIATSGEDGKASLGDNVAAGQGNGAAVGWIVFSSCIEYDSEENFAADVNKHRVPTDSI